jgi:hypothetical protein
MDGSFWNEFKEGLESPFTAEDEQRFYFVRFFGTYEIAIVPAPCVFLYHMLPIYLRPVTADASLSNAIAEASLFMKTGKLPEGFSDTIIERSSSLTMVADEDDVQLDEGVLQDVHIVSQDGRNHQQASCSRPSPQRRRGRSRRWH